MVLALEVILVMPPALLSTSRCFLQFSFLPSSGATCTSRNEPFVWPYIPLLSPSFPSLPLLWEQPPLRRPCRQRVRRQKILLS